MDKLINQNTNISDLLDNINLQDDDISSKLFLSNQTNRPEDGIITL